MIYQLIVFLIPMVGVGALIIGLAAMIMPIKMSGIFGVPIDGKAAAFVIGMGIRDLFIGASILMLYSLHLIIPAGWCLLFLGAVSFSDFLCVFKLGSRKISYTHLLGAILVTALAGMLLWFIPYHIG